MSVSKFAKQPIYKQMVSKINEIIDNLGTGVGANVDLSNLSSTGESHFLKKDVDTDITALFTFLGQKRINFKQSSTTDKLGFTCFNNSGTELGAFEYRPNTISGKALLNVNCPYTGDYVGFRYWGTNVNIVAPKVATAGTYYIPTHITDGNTTVTATNAGVLNISSLFTGYATESFVTSQGYITGITSSDVITALSYTPYNSTNPNGYQANVIETIKVNGTALTPISKTVDITVPSAVTESTVSGWGFTKNAGTITGITMNGSSKGTSGVVDLGTVITAHQDISGKQDKITSTNKLSADLISDGTTNKTVTATEKTTWNNKIDSSAISDMATKTWVGQQGYTSNVGTVTSVNNTQPDADGNVSLTIPDTSVLANKDLSNLSSTGEAHFQAPLVSGTNIKTINNTNLLGSGNIDISEIFVANFSTTYAEIGSALLNNKIVVLNVSGNIYQYAYSSGTEYQFARVISTYSDDIRIEYYTINTSNVWNLSVYTAADTALSNLSTTGEAHFGKVKSVNNTSPDANGNVTISIPSTSGLANTNLSNLSATGKTVLDGQWVTLNQTIFESQSLTNSSNTDLQKTVNVPNDGKIYEVLLSCTITTGSTSGNTIAVSVGTNKMNPRKTCVCGARTRSSSTVGNRGNVILPISYASNNLYIKRDSGYNGTADLWAIAYRRVGSNT